MMRLFRVILFLTLLLAVSAAYAAGYGKGNFEKIQLKGAVLMTKRKVALGDICTLINRKQADKELVSDESLKNIEIDNLKPMEVAVISRVNIERKLKNLGISIPVIGADGIRVTRRGRIWTPSDIEKELRAWIFNALKASEKTLRIQFVSRFRQITLPVDVEIKEELPPNIKPYGLNSVRLTFRDSGVKIFSQNVSVRLDRKIEAFILRRDMVKGEVLNMESFKKSEIFASKISKTEIIDPSPYWGWKLKTFIAKGKLIKPSYLDKSYMVKRGSIVNIVAEKYGFSVRAKGYARKNGVKNDFIPIQNIASGKVVLGEVVDINLVRVGF